VLTGASEAPGPGDTKGSGTATVTLAATKGQVCYEISVSGIGEPSAAHIHQAPAGVAGDIVVPFATPAGGKGSGCVDVAKDLLGKIVANPAGFYVNVHTAEFPKGAVRGQLAK
jgi:hypothetical protein